MSEEPKNWYRMYRGWQDDDAFEDEPYTEREAWEWLIANAAWEPVTINIKGNPFKLEIGQLSHSIRFMGDKWKWHPSKVKRFLDKIKKWEKIETATETGQNLITICNYKKYQFKRDRSETAIETGPKQDRNKDKEYNNIITTVVDVTREKNFSDAVPNEPKPDAAPVKADAALRSHVEIGKQIAKVTGWDTDPNWFGDYARIEIWLKNGWCPERDIMPTVHRLMDSLNRQNSEPPRSLKYFEQAIANAHTKRNLPLPKGNPNERAHANAGNKPFTSADARAAVLAEYGFPDHSDGGAVLRHSGHLRQDTQAAAKPHESHDRGSAALPARADRKSIPDLEEVGE